MEDYEVTGAFRCSACGKIEHSRNLFWAHCAIPVMELPVGLAFKYKNYRGSGQNPVVVIMGRERVDTVHIATHCAEVRGYSGNGDRDSTYGEISTREVFHLVEEGRIEALDASQLEEFARNNPDITQILQSRGKTLINALPLFT